MGTRNLTLVVSNEKICVAQYCQWDGYPGGQGTTVYQFLKDKTPEDLERFGRQVNALRHVSEEEVREMWKECGADDSGFVTLEISARMKEQYPEFQRDLGAGILERVFEEKTRSVQLQSEFAADSLFCEWAYLIDLDKGRLEVYRGFQRAPHEGRFSHLYDSKSKYYPIRLLVDFPLDELPETLKKFIDICDVACEADRKQTKLLQEKQNEK